MSLAVPLPFWIRLIALAFGVVAVAVDILAVVAVAVIAVASAQDAYLYGWGDQELHLKLRDGVCAIGTMVAATGVAWVCWSVVSDWLMPTEEGIAA